MEPEWIPREENQIADYISAFSRIVDHNDWMLNPLVFEELDALWTVDRIADGYNSQPPPPF